MLKILLVDEHQIVREGIKQLLEKNSDIIVTEEIDSINDAVIKIREQEFDAVLLNSITPNHSDLDLIRNIKNIRPKTPVLVLCASSDVKFCEKTLKAGANGFLTKQSATEELIQAIRMITRGNRFISPSMMENMVDFKLCDSQVPRETLSDREYEVMLAIISGKRIKQIAKELSLSIKTVSTYHSRILQKLKFNSDAEMIRYAIEEGIIQNSIAARGNLVLAEIGFMTGSAIAAIKEIWSIRKDVILILIVTSIISYVFLSFLVSVLF
jgi:DNA-binding NarL/FixJ family response regulator